MHEKNLEMKILREDMEKKMRDQLVSFSFRHIPAVIDNYFFLFLILPTHYRTKWTFRTKKMRLRPWASATKRRCFKMPSWKMKWHCKEWAWTIWAVGSQSKHNSMMCVTESSRQWINECVTFFVSAIFFLLAHCLTLRIRVSVQLRVLKEKLATISSQKIEIARRKE